MKRTFAAIGALLAGWFAAFIFLIGVELFSSIVHPFPPDFGGTPEEICRHVERYPSWVLALVVPMWGGTAFTGSWIAGRWGNQVTSSLTALLLIFGVVFNVAMLPYPMWFQLVQPVAVVGASAWAVRLAARARAVLDAADASASTGG